MSTIQTQQQNQPSAKVQLPKQQGERKGFTNQEIQTIEADRKEPEKWNVVHLLRDGNYWHANEWSAWLVAVVITSQMKHLHPDMEIIPPTAVKKYAKNIGGEYIFVGFQEKSFDKYLPKELTLDWRDVEDGRIDVPIQMPDDHGELTYERLQAAYEKWKSEQPLSKEKDKKESTNGDRQGRGGAIGDTPGHILAIVGRIMSLPLHRTSPIDAHKFLEEVQRELLAHL